MNEGGISFLQYYKSFRPYSNHPDQTKWQNWVISPPYQTVWGDRLLAAEGCKFDSAQNPHEPDNHFKTFPNEKGFNIRNLNALYDFCNRIYVDAIVPFFPPNASSPQPL